jgi:hypothetical protein
MLPLITKRCHRSKIVPLLLLFSFLASISLYFEMAGTIINKVESCLCVSANEKGVAYE